MDFVIGLLIAWSVGKANRVGKQINGLTDHALDLAVGRVWNIVAAKLGSTNPAIGRLVAEAQRGDVSPRTRADAQRVIDEAVAADPQFGAALREAASPVAQTSSQRSNTRQFAGVSLEGASVAGSVDIRNKSKIVNYASKHPGVTIVAVIVVIILAGLVIGRMTGTGADAGSASGLGPGRSETNSPSGSASPRGRTTTDSSAIIGTWTASDATGTKTFGSSGGRCDGFYYYQGKPLDIGGPMTCVISGKADADGRYSLVVTQSPNRSTYKVEFSDADHAVVFDSAGTRLYELERF
ncbi:hypothetical protein [Nocardia pseudovaccinii]|uniref:hypothetical protein n=1 Tax=Nocardia pseudovaccinii TaxID=189540 RepID=UPI0007A3E758|nr:hypothetical protein [Nocardia pseudovaccinii]